MAFPGPYEWTNKLTLNPTPFSAGYLGEMRKSVKGLDSMGVVLVDVSKTPSIAYAINFTKTSFAASLPKIAAMYASYYLRDRLMTLSSGISLLGMSLKEIESTLKAEWKEEMRSILPAVAKDFPDITSIFGGTDFRFSDAHRKDLIKMIQESNNWSAGRVIHRVGYDYINGALIHGGLYSVTDKSGLWLGGDYIPASSIANRDGRSPKGLGTSQAASAKATALLLANMALDTLISPTQSLKMRNLMNNASSWVRDKVQSIHPTAEVFGKVGFVGGKHPSMHDCAIVKYDSMHYVVVTLFGVQDLDPLLADLDSIAQRLF